MYKGLKIGDLVEHTRSKRIGMVMENAYLFRGIVNLQVCRVTWMDNFKSNLMCVDALTSVRKDA
jgi:hypothetical protein